MDDYDMDELDFEEFDEFDEGDSDDFDDDDADDADYDDYDGEDDLFGEYASEGRRRRSRRRRARARMRAARRRRALQRRRRSSRSRPRSRPRTSSGRIASNRAQIKKVGLESAVKSDLLANGLKSQNKRIDGTENAITATKVIDEIRTQFPGLADNKFIKTGLPLAPLLFLKPPKKKDGVQGLAMDPRVWGPVLAAGAALYQEYQGGNGEAAQVQFEVGGVLPLTTNSGKFPLVVRVRDKNGRLLEGRNITYTTNSRAVATVNEKGEVDPKAKGNTAIVATDTASKLTATVLVTVTDP